MILEVLRLLDFEDDGYRRPLLWIGLQVPGRFLNVNLNSCLLESN
ncbi:uncharacterized protein OCT59_011265 [Rhizophagus irregularis]|nr:hypothetical protein OCT59_011265 [Rhizophagus irregularis]